jgi:hypothetical protein
MNVEFWWGYVWESDHFEDLENGRTALRRTGKYVLKVGG